MAAATSIQAIDIGTVIADTYEVVGLLGRGGMGSVWAATHRRLPGKKVAVKVLNAEVGQDPQALARFRREAEIASRLGHPNIVAVHDYNVLDDGTPYLILEYLEGEPLSRRIERGPVPLDQAFSIVRQIGSALRAAHAQQVIHRDLKPQNIFLCPTEADGLASERVVVLDFGISKIRDSSTIKTQTATVLGTPQYMAPEQATGNHAKVDPRTDLFAFGAIVYEMLSGRPTFAGETIPEVVFKVVYEPHRPLAELVPALSPQICAAVHRALEKKQEDRFPDVASFVEALTGRPITTMRGAGPAAVALASTMAADAADVAAAIAPHAAGAAQGSAATGAGGAAAAGNPAQALAATMAAGAEQASAAAPPAGSEQALAATMAAGAEQTGAAPPPAGDSAGAAQGSTAPPPAGDGAASAQAATAVPATATQTLAITRGGRRWPLVAGAVAVAAVAVALTLAITRSDHHHHRHRHDFRRRAAMAAVGAAAARHDQAGGPGRHADHDDSTAAHPSSPPPAAGDHTATATAGNGRASAAAGTSTGTSTTTASTAAHRAARPDTKHQAHSGQSAKSGPAHQAPPPSLHRLTPRLIAARRALAHGHPGRAVLLASRSLETRPSPLAFAVRTQAYCQEHDLGQARASFIRIRNKQLRRRVKRYCRRYDVHLQ